MIISKWVIKHVDRVTRYFLWRNQLRTAHRAAWCLCIKPTSLEGLGIRDLKFKIRRYFVTSGER